MTRTRWFFVFSVMLLLSLWLTAQVQNGNISGTVTDPSGAVVPGATVTATSTTTGLTRSATTSGNGVFAINNLPPGPYGVKIAAQGFGPFTGRTAVSVGGTSTLDAKLQLQAASTAIEVVGAGGVEVNTENQTLSQVVTGQELVNLPTLTRNPYDLVATAGNVSQGDTHNETTRGAGFNINGQRSASTDILLDGAENQDLFTATVGQTVPLDSVQEFRVITSDFTAQYGRASGGVVNVATKSGTNNFHGTAYEFNRISALASNTYENDARMKDAIATGACLSTSDPTCPGQKGVFTRNQFGGSLGGPIVKDKLFFFGNLEALRVRSNGVQNLLVPMPQLIAAAAPATQSFFNTFGKLTHPVNGTVFTVGDLASQGGPVFNSLPASTPAFGVVNFPVASDAGGGNPENTWLAVGRVDFNMTDRTTMFGRYSLQKENDFAGVVNFSPYTGFDTGQTIMNNSALFAINHIFSSSFISQTRLEYNRLNLQQPLGTAPVGPTLYMNPTNEGTINGVGVAFPGYNELTPGSAIPFGGPQNLGQIFEDLNWTKGSHNLKFGGQFIYTQDNRAFGAYEESVEALGKTGTVPQALDNFLTGNLFQFQGAVFPQGKFPCATDVAGNVLQTPACTVTLPVAPPNFSRSNRYRDSALYFQDTWKVRPTLTLDLGLRWEYYGVQHDKDPNLDSNFYLGSGDNIYQQIANGAVFTVPNAPISPKGIWQPKYRNFAPRVGFAWDVFGNGKTSLRGGYGIAYERNFGNVTFNVIQNPPNYAVLSLTSGVDVPTIPVTTANAGPLAGSAGTLPLPVTSLRAIQQDLPTAYAQIWSFSLEREIVPNTVLSLAYSGSRGLHQYLIENPNRQGSGVIYLGDNPAVNPLARMNLQYSNINLRAGGGDNYYNGLNVGLRSTVNRLGLHLNANYTWSHTIDELSTTFSESNNSFNLGLTDPFNPLLDKGSADYDIRHRVVVSAVWSLPFAKNSSSAFWRNLVGGFQLAPIFEAHTGTPFTIYDCTNGQSVCPRWDPGSSVGYATSVSSDPASTGVNLFNILPLPASGGAIVGTGNPADANPLLSAAAGFAVSDFGPSCNTPGSGALGPCLFPSSTTGRNAFRGPGWWNFTLAGYKDLKFTERLHLQLRAEAFNILNHHNFYVLGNTTDVSQLTDGVQAKKGGLGSANAPTAAGPSVLDERRNIQLGVKLIW